MKILFIGGYPFPGQPHKNIFNYRAVNQLAQKANVDVINIRMWSPKRKFVTTEEHENLRVFHLCIPQFPSQTSFNFTMGINLVYAQLKFFLKKLPMKEYDVIHSTGASYFGLIGGLISRKHNIPHVIQFIGSDINSDFVNFASHDYVKKFPQWVDGIGSNSADMLSIFESRYGKTAHPKKVIYRGIDLQRFQFKNHPEITKGARFLFLGGLPAYPDLIHKMNTKGGLSLMEAWKSSEEELFKHGATLSFAGPDSDNEVFQQWHRALKYPERVTLVGVLKPDQVREAYGEHHVVIIPSMEEGLPNVAVESSATGRMVIGSRVGGVPEIVVHNGTGMIFEAGDVKALASCLLQSASNHEQVIQFGRAARQRVEEKFDASNFADNYINLYKETISCVG
jgi:glycosyltransferase involved in cell wall biosynthesis